MTKQIWSKYPCTTPQNGPQLGFTPPSCVLSRKDMPFATLLEITHHVVLGTIPIRKATDDAL